MSYAVKNEQELKKLLKKRTEQKLKDDLGDDASALLKAMEKRLTKLEKQYKQDHELLLSYIEKFEHKK